MPMYSRDGYHFSRPSRESIINASIHKGEWDRGYVQSVGGTVIINGDELWIYYIGFGGDESRNNGSWVTNGMYCNGATGIAKLRRDGFVSMNGNGSLVTRKLTFTNKKSMFVNAKGKVQVKIFDSDGCEIATSRVFDGDSTKAEVNDGKNTATNELLSAPVIVSDRTFVPLRFVSENFDAYVEYVAPTRQVIITDEEALHTAKELARLEGLLCGISSGTNVAAAIKLAKKLGKGKTVVTVLPDTAERYYSTPLFNI
jgi:hypothetical protein